MKITKGMNRVVKDGKVYGYDVATGKVYDTATFEEITDDGGDDNEDNTPANPDTENSGTEENSSKAKATKIK